jgi:YD repeat-containing protein
MPFRRRALMAALLSATFVAQPLGSVASALGVGHAKSRAVIAYDGVVPPIPVKEPLRTKPSFGPRDMMRPRVVPAIRPLNGRRVSGPPLLRPDQIDAAIRDVRRRNTAPVRQQPLPVSPTSPVPRPQLRGPVRGSVGAQSSGTRSVQSLPNNPTGSGTGINPWWRYQEENVPGGGHVMVNVGTGNLVLQDDDMNVPHKGIALAFRRTYNSQSLHDVYGDDGAPGMYGNGWTSTFDAHLSGTSSSINVWDIDGAMYTYTFQSNGTWQAPAGQHATLASDGACGFLWTKKTGTTYYFWAPYQPSTCTASYTTYGGYAGRLYEIIGRNRNVTLSFAYSWDNGIATPAGKISEIVVSTESGLTASLAFADVSGYRLLQTLTLPDGATTVTYGYDTVGDLVTISHPPNNAAGIRPTQLLNYQRVGGNLLINFAASPKTDAACVTSGGCYSDGGGLLFTFAGTSAPTSTVTSIQQAALVNPTISDGTNAGPIQGSTYATSVYTYDTEYFTTGVLTPAFRDTDGHMTSWMVDTSGRPTQTQECTASANQGQQCTGRWLTTRESWDANNNRIAEIDARGNETDYAYDNNGNTIAVAAAAPSTGMTRPTRLFDYDGLNNVVAYCDETETDRSGADWSGPPTISDSLCSASAQAHGVLFYKATYTYPSSEPSGELASMTTPLGYTLQLSYSAAQEGGSEAGLPTTVTGSSFTQVDLSSITPTQTFWYDVNGYLRCYSKGNGTSVLSYDAIGRMTSVADADDSSANAGSLCGKSAGKPGWNTQVTTAYFADGLVQSTQSPAERAAGVSTTFTYDLDGNEISETHHFGCASGKPCTPGITNKWYDGADRLVEVGLPHDSTDLYSSQWLTRYLYDLSAGGLVYMAGLGYHASGNLFKTQEWVPASANASPSWTDLKGSAYDSLDREVAMYGFSPSSNTTLRAKSFAFDASSATLGLLASQTDQLGEVTTYAYDNLARTTAVQFAGDGGVTPSNAFGYDLNGRVVSATNSVYGTTTTAYDADGRVSEVDEPTTGAITSPAKLTYDYYPNGQRKDLNVTSTALTAAPLYTYDYRVDGKRTAIHLLYGPNQGSFSTSYTDAGRNTSRTDPFTGSAMPNPQSPVAAGALYGPTTWAYDTNGQLSNLQIPQTLAYSLSHDDEGQVVGWTGSYSNNGPATMTFQNTVRGENVLQALAGAGTSTFQTRIANGASVRQPPPVIPGSTSPPVTDYAVAIDPTNAAIASTSQDSYVVNSDPDAPNKWENCGLSTVTKNYDNASRFVSQTTTMSGGTGAPDCADVYNPNPITATLHSYDAEDHHTEVTGGVASIQWTPQGHAFKLGTTCLHYDGNMILFSTGATGSLSQVKVETLADVTPTSLSILDRDFSGHYVSRHNNVFYGGVDLGTTVYRAAWQASQSVPHIFPGSTNDSTCNSSGCGSAGNLEYARLEGFEYGTLTFQGSRAVDNASGQWTTPDAFAGDVHDPMSQKPFMWDRNNPYEYSDPSGFAPQPMQSANQDGSWAGGITSAGQAQLVALTGGGWGPDDIVDQKTAQDFAASIIQLVTEDIDAGEFVSTTQLEAKFKEHGREVHAIDDLIYESAAKSLLDKWATGVRGIEAVVSKGISGGLALKLWDGELFGTYNGNGRAINLYALGKAAWTGEKKIGVPVDRSKYPWGVGGGGGW